MYENENNAYPIGNPSDYQVGKPANPTLRENIAQKIQYHKDEIVRLEKITATMTAMLDVNLRDLREAMSF